MVVRSRSGCVRRGQGRGGLWMEGWRVRANVAGQGGGGGLVHSYRGLMCVSGQTQMIDLACYCLHSDFSCQESTATYPDGQLQCSLHSMPVSEASDRVS